MSIYKIPETFDKEKMEYWSWELSSRHNVQTFIYVIQQGNEGPIKIGISKRPSLRLQSLQTGNPERLKLILQRFGTRKDEKRLHHLLEAHRIDGEWFEFCLPVKSVIEELL